MNKNKIWRTFARVLLITALLALIVNINSPFHKTARFYGYAIGTPDAYGNVIMNLTIYQYNGTHWNQLLFWDTDTNWAVRVEPDDAINITLWVRLNDTLASDAAESISYTRILCNITIGIWNNVEFNNTDDGSDADYYYCEEQGHWNQSGYPVSGTSYDVVTRYEAYY